MAAGGQLAGGRILLRQPEAGDQAGYEAVFMDAEVSAWLRPPPEPPFDPSSLAEMLAEDLRHWRDAGFGPWVLAEVDGGAMVGRVGLHRTSIAGELVTELAWAMLPAWQGRGLATGAAREAIALGRSVGLQELVALVLPQNLASRRVAEKLDMRASGEVTHAGLPHLLYRLQLGEGS